MLDNAFEAAAMPGKRSYFAGKTSGQSIITRQDNLREVLNPISHVRQFDCGATIVADGDEAGIVGQVTSGVVRITQTLADGRQQVVGLAMAGDYFGHFFDSGHAFTFEAATEVSAIVFRRKAFETIVASNHELEHTIMMAILRDLELSREWMMVLGCQNSFERVVSFMLHMHRRMIEAGVSKDNRIIEFPIGRRDIAAYLGTTVETISRHIQALARQRVIRILDSSHFEICNLGRLRAMAKQH